MSPGDVAGAVTQNNWNNTAGGASGSLNSVVDDSNQAVTGMSVNWSFNTSYSVPSAGTNGDLKLFDGYVDATAQGVWQSINVSNVPYTEYDVYVYVGSDENGRLGRCRINGGGTEYYYLTNVNPFTGYQRCTATNAAARAPANYILFEAVTGSTLTIEVMNDGGNNGSHGFQIVARFTPVPRVATSPGKSLHFLGQGPIVVDDAVTVADDDSANLQSATVTITNLPDAGQEFLAATPSGVIGAGNISYAAPTLTITANAPLADYQAVLRSVTYDNASGAPDLTDRVIRFAVNDGANASNNADKAVAVGGQLGAGAVAINEIHYEQNNKFERVEFIELYNDGATVADLSGWYFSDGVSYTFPPLTYLAPGDYLVVAQHPGDLAARFGGVSALGPWTGSLSNNGETVTLRNAAGSRVDEVAYGIGFPWPTMASGEGSSMELINPTLDNDLGGSWRCSGYDTGAYLNSPTPGALNSVYSSAAPPQLRQVEHTPHQPQSGQDVAVTAKITDPDGVASVNLKYQLVNPGSYIRLSDAAYTNPANWTTVAMHDDGINGDAVAGDDVYTAVLPAALNTHRRLIRYRITATDTGAQAVTAPLDDDEQPNFAYFVYNGAPSWTGSVRPGVAPNVTYPASLMNGLPTYHLLSTHQDVVDCMYHPGTTRGSGYGGADYLWEGTLVYDGDVYDHLHYRARGGVWRYAMGKNMWKFRFNTARRFQARDDYGKKYDTQWRRLNLSAIIQQGNYLHRGEQGLFESVGFKLFNLAGTESPKTNFISFRVIDDAAEATGSQFNGDLWGMYLVIEQPDGRLLDEHNMTDSNVYKMQGGTGVDGIGGELKHQADWPAVWDSSDLITYKTTYESGTQPEQWWRDNVDLWRYYSYRTILMGIHHYDIAAGKNYYYFNQIQPDIWSVHPWDLDLTWSNNMYGSENEPFRNRVLYINNNPHPIFHPEYRNRAREIRDLLFNTDQAYQLIDEMAVIPYTAGQDSWVDVDCAMWDYNPILISGYVNSSKAGHGRFYESAVPAGSGFPGMVQKMKNYVVTRSAFIDGRIADANIPNKPTATYTGAPTYPPNNLTFSASAFSDPQGAGTFSAMKWRIGEVTDPLNPTYDPTKRVKYEIEDLWESAEITPYSANIVIPSAGLESGKSYRVRVRMKDNTGRWSHWSDAVQFIAGAPDNAAALTDHLRVTEVMYNPPAGSDYEFIELYNNSPTIDLDLNGVTLSDGIDYAFAGVTLARQSYLLLVNSDPASDFNAFRQHYGGAALTVPIYGPYGGRLNNAGERLRVSAAGGVIHILAFEYNDARGWPLAPDGGGHSLVPLDSALPTAPTDSLYYGGHWRSSTYINGSPGAADPTPPVTVVLNELMAHTDYFTPPYDSNDWVELYNPTNATVSLTGWYLSDDVEVPQKWAIPAGTSILALNHLVFDEVTGFHSDPQGSPTSGFGLNKDGEELLLSHFPGGSQNRIVDTIRFKGQEDTASLGRLPDGDAPPFGPFHYPLTPTRDAPNAGNQMRVVINEIMYHPSDGTTTSEYLEIYNPGAAAAQLWTAEGEWRIDGGVSYTFPPNTSIPAGDCLLIVPFDPANAASLNVFMAAHGVASIPCPVLGPYTGNLNNRVERVALERPQAPDVVGGNVSWVIRDEAIYFEQAPFPPAADGTGPSLHRIDPAQSGNDPANWTADPPTPGEIDAIERPSINLRPATSVASQTATLNGEVVDTGGENPIIRFYWDTVDGGAAGANWRNWQNVGVVGAGPYSLPISGLSPSTLYYFQTYAINSAGSRWGTVSGSFTTTAQSYTLTVASANGSVTRGPNQPQYNPGAPVTLTPVPNADYFFSHWSGDVPPGDENDNPLQLTINADVSLTAHFVKYVNPRLSVDMWRLY